MPKYKRLFNDVEAVQFTGKNQKAISDFVGKGGTVETNGGFCVVNGVSAAKGDYVAKDEDSVRVFAASKFESAFAEVKK